MEEERISLRGLAEDPWVTRYCPMGIDDAILERQLRDPTLYQWNLYELTEMDLEELATCAFTHMMAEEDALAQPPAPDDDGEAFAADGIPDGLSGITIQIEGLGVEAKIILQEPADGRRGYTRWEISEALAARGVVQGIREDFITRLAERPVFGRRFKIAEGKLPVDGMDGSAVFHFDTSVDLSPRIREDGSADYKSLDYVKNVHEGDLLCEIIPPVRGSDGVSVRGEVLRGRPGKPADVRAGANTVLSEDGLKIYAACDGQVYLKNGRVIVSRVMLIDRVDASTGNILFVGTVQIKGDVSGGYMVRAGGDIIVGGVVEDAILVAGGNIVLCGGMKGRDIGQLDAGGDIRTFFLENAKIRAKNSIYADSILNSDVECGQTVSLSGANGCLVGGRCSAGRTIQALRIGNSANIATLIRLGEIESFAAQRAKIEAQAASMRETVKRLEHIVSITAESISDATPIMVARMAIVRLRFEHEIQTLERKIPQKSDASRVVVAREALYPNTVVEIDGAVLRVRGLQYRCEAVNLRGRIVLSPR